MNRGLNLRDSNFEKLGYHLKNHINQLAWREKVKNICNVNIIYSHMVIHLPIQAVSLARLQACSETKETNVANKLNIVQNPNRQEADQLAIYKA